MRKPCLTYGLMIAVFLLGAVGPARGGKLGIKTGELIQGKTTAVEIRDVEGTPMADVTVEAIFRPGSKVQEKVTIGTTGSNGTIDWTPHIAGIVKLEISQQIAGDPDTGGVELTKLGETTVAVTYSDIPARSIIVLILAGSILFGGIIWAYTQLGKPVEYFDPTT
ncbi:hypothetical protein ACFLU6_02720 [Acidobacteriota bacterium]